MTTGFTPTLDVNPEILTALTKPKAIYREVVANVSAYTASIEECGKDDGITASGTSAIEGRTIAMDDVPFGTKVEINGNVFVVEDRFGGEYRNRVDIYMVSRLSANRFGRQQIPIKIYDQGVEP